MTHREADHCSDDRDRGRRSEVKFVVSAPTAPFGVAAAGNVKSAARRRRGRSHYPSLSLQQQQVDTSDRWRTPILPPTRSDDEADGRARWAL